MAPITGDLTVYVPTATSDLRLALAPGCAIVGGRRAGGNSALVVVDLEDNRYGKHPPTSDMAVYLDCLVRAAGRHRSRYPTVARLAVDPNSLVPVGVLDEAGVFRLDDATSLVEWRQP